MSAAAPSAMSQAQGQPVAAPAAPDYASANADFMARSRRFPIRMPLVGGALTGTYATNTTLNFIAPPVNNGWLDMIELDVNIQATVATATATTNRAWPFNLLSYITVNLDGQISYIEPYEVYLYWRTIGRLRGDVTTNVAGISGTQQGAIMSTGSVGSGATLTVGANNVRFRMKVPLNALHPLDGSGMLPTQGTQDPVQVNVQVPGALIGPDPLIHPAMSATGTATITGTSTVTCYGWVRDGRTKWSPSEQLPFYPNGLPQVSWDKEPNIVNLAANQLVRGQLTKVLKVYYMWAVLIDGQQSADFSTPNNLNMWDWSADSTGNFEFLVFGLNNVPIDLEWSDIRADFGQDFPYGVIPMVYAAQNNIPAPDVSNGTDILNMMAGGWTSMYQGVNFAAIGAVANVQPRVVTYIIGANDSPYIG